MIIYIKCLTSAQASKEEWKGKRETEREKEKKTN